VILCVKDSEICNADIRELSLSVDGCCMWTRQRHYEQLQQQGTSTTAGIGYSLLDYCYSDERH